MTYGIEIIVLDGLWENLKICGSRTCLEIISASLDRIGAAVDYQIVGVELESLKIGSPRDLPADVDHRGIVYIAFRCQYSVLLYLKIQISMI